MLLQTLLTAQKHVFAQWYLGQLLCSWAAASQRQVSCGDSDRTFKGPADNCHHFIPLSSPNRFCHSTHVHTHQWLFSHHNYSAVIYSLEQRKAELCYYLKQIVLSALSATALAFSISVAWRWKAMYCSQRMELLGLLSTRRSKSSADCGCRLGSIRAASNLQSSFSFFCLSSSFSFFVRFFSWKNIKEGTSWGNRQAQLKHTQAPVCPRLGSFHRKRCNQLFKTEEKRYTPHIFTVHTSKKSSGTWNLIYFRTIHWGTKYFASIAHQLQDSHFTPPSHSSVFTLWASAQHHHHPL